jgi:hypothetical protein
MLIVPDDCIPRAFEPLIVGVPPIAIQFETPVFIVGVPPIAIQFETPVFIVGVPPIAIQFETPVFIVGVPPITTLPRVTLSDTARAAGPIQTLGAVGVSATSCEMTAG